MFLKKPKAHECTRIYMLKKEMKWNEKNKLIYIHFVPRVIYIYIYRLTKNSHSVSQPKSLSKNVGPQSRDQECRHVRRHAARRRRLCHAGARKVQHREGHSRLHKERVRQEVQPDMALHSRPQLRLVRDARDQAFHLLLSRPSRNSFVQIGLEWHFSHIFNSPFTYILSIEWKYLFIFNLYFDELNLNKIH